MSPLGSISPLLPGTIERIDLPAGKIGRAVAQPAPAAGAANFSQMLDGLVATVDAKQQTATELTRQVLLGGTDQVHQSVIAMQEAGVAFSLMVEVRNKLVESYQELMRLQV